MVEPITIGTAVGWGVSALGWVASPIISKLLTKGFDYLGYDTAKKLGQLEPKLLVLERVMEVVDRSPYRPRLEQLFKELKTAFYEAEEILDVVKYHCLERQIQDAKLQSEGGAPPRKRDRIKTIRSAMAKVSFLKNKESGMSNKKLVKSLKRIENVINKAHQILEKLNLSSRSDGSIRQTMVANPTTTAVSPQEVFGRDNDHDKIIAMLHEKESDLHPSTSNMLFCNWHTEVDGPAFFKLFMHYALGCGQEHILFQTIGEEIAKKLKGSPLAARTVGGTLRRQQEVDHWRRFRDQDLFKVWTGPLWWSYYQLGEQARRCFAYCSIFPRRHRLFRDDLVSLWMAEGFIRSRGEGMDIEDVGQEIFDQLLSVSFLQPGVKDFDRKNGCFKYYYLVHDLLHDLAKVVAGSDCFRIVLQLKHLRYLAFRTCSGCRVILPSSLNQLYQMQLLDFGACMNLVFSCGDLINLRHVCSGIGLEFSNISRLVSLQTIPTFRVSHKQGHEGKQLRYLNRLSGELCISGVESVESREEALEFDLTLAFYGSSKVAAVVLEGLCPPVGLETLSIWDFNGLVYPNWMVSGQNGGPEKLQKLFLYGWRQPGPAPELEAFIHLRLLHLYKCSCGTPCQAIWSTLARSTD